MGRKIILFGLLFVCFACSVSGQQANHQTKEKYVVIPDDLVLATIAYQPDCPLRFEDAKILAAMDGSEVAAYAVRNIGTKPIRSYTLAVPGATIGWEDKLTKKLFMPGERTPGDEDIEIVPLTDELRNKLKLNGPMRTLVLFMVIRVEYADGTVYSAESTYKAFKKYADEMDELSEMLRANRKSK